MQMEKTYSPGAIEERWYRRWEESGVFQPSGEGSPYTIVIPPPNVTGILHMGHALDHTLEDIPIRFQRMRGRRVLWLPGTDHAGIGTQNVVERALEAEGSSREELGREAFVKRVWEWVEEYGGRITQQMRRLGDSVDWSRERFTFDDGLSRAVSEVFVRLYEKGLIYRGHYIINWCPRCGTALSDDEVTHVERDGHLWHIRYPGADGSDGVVVATTRPETMLGDTGVAVHPEDDRYRSLIGKKVLLPLLDRPMPVVADESVDREFGTGAVKVTPAHDPNDFEIGRRHGLETLVALDEKAVVTGIGGPYAGRDRLDARKALVKDLEAEGYLVRVEEHRHSVGHCYRCRTVIEPYLSDQWFVKMKPLALRALEHLDRGEPRIQPARWEKVYRHWLENIRDWCISRQLWWGHRIPIWYCSSHEDAHAKASSERPGSPCEDCGRSDWVQDPDVLDTWFSSWLWPFSTLGWPQETEDLALHYPTSLLISGYDILFFWDTRMVMAGLEFTDRVPFETLYIHGMIQDELGRPMSKSLGNGIDPIEMIGRYGADAVRYSLCMLTTEGQDIKLSESKFEMGRNFANKLWNASRFVLMNLQSGPIAEGPLPLESADRWILSRFEGRIRHITELLEGLKYSEAARELYAFVWNEFCDWYLEMVKDRLRSHEERASASARAMLAHLLDGILRLLHPYMPFVTSEIWDRLGETMGGERVSLTYETEAEEASERITGALAGREAADGFLMSAAWPRAVLERPDREAESQLALVQDVVGAVRQIKGEMGVPPGVNGTAHVRTSDESLRAALEEQKGNLIAMAALDDIVVGTDVRKPPASGSAVVGGLQIHLPLAGLIDLTVEKRRLEKERARLEGLLKVARSKLSNRQFLARAPAEVVEKEQQKHDQLADQSEKVNQLLANLES